MSSPNGARQYQKCRKETGPCYYLACDANGLNVAQGFKPGTDGPDCVTDPDLNPKIYAPADPVGDMWAAIIAVRNRLCAGGCCEVTVKVNCDPKWMAQVKNPRNGAFNTAMCGRTLPFSCT